MIGVFFDFAKFVHACGHATARFRRARLCTDEVQPCPRPRCQGSADRSSASTPFRSGCVRARTLGTHPAMDRRAGRVGGPPGRPRKFRGGGVGICRPSSNVPTAPPTGASASSTMFPSSTNSTPCFVTGRSLLTMARRGNRSPGVSLSMLPTVEPAMSRRMFPVFHGPESVSMGLLQRGKRNRRE